MPSSFCPVSLDWSHYHLKQGAKQASDARLVDLPVFSVGQRQHRSSRVFISTANVQNVESGLGRGAAILGIS